MPDEQHTNALPVTLTADGRRCWMNREVAARHGLNGDAVAQLIRATLTDSPSPQQVLKRDRRSQVSVHEAAGERWVVKRHFISSVIGRLYHMLRVTPAWREWRGAATLTAAGLRTNPPLALVGGTHSAAAGGVLIFPYVEGPTVQQVVTATAATESPSESDQRLRQALARGIARQIARYIEVDVHNRDLKPANLIVDGECRATGDPIIIDPSGLRRFTGAPSVDQMLTTCAGSIIRVGHLTAREGLICLRELARLCPAIAPSRETRHAMFRRIKRLAEADRDASLAREQRVKQR